MKMLKHKQQKVEPSKNVQPCLAELIFGISLDGSFDSSKQLSFDVSLDIYFNLEMTIVVTIFIMNNFLETTRYIR